MQGQVHKPPHTQAATPTQQQFADRIRRVWRERKSKNDVRGTDALVERLATDTRIRKAREVLSNVPDQRLLAFLGVLQIAVWRSGRGKEFRAEMAELPEHLETAQAAVRTLRRLLDGPLAALVPEVLPKFFLEAPWAAQSLAREFEKDPLSMFLTLERELSPKDVMEWLKRAEQRFREEQLRAERGWEFAKQYLPRKAAAQAMFMRDVAGLMRRLTGKPHYPVVAELASVVFDLGGDTDLTEAARSADRNRKRPIPA